MDASVLGPRDETRALEDPKVPRDGRQRDRERPREIAHRRLGSAGKMRQDRAAGRVRQRPERRVEGRGIVNHMVNYMTRTEAVKPAGTDPTEGPTGAKTS